jgi:hypothetical protein
MRLGANNRHPPQLRSAVCKWTARFFVWRGVRPIRSISLGHDRRFGFRYTQGNGGGLFSEVINIAQKAHCGGCILMKSAPGVVRGALSCGTKKITRNIPSILGERFRTLFVVPTAISIGP